MNIVHTWHVEVKSVGRKKYWFAHRFSVENESKPVYSATVVTKSVAKNRKGMHGACGDQIRACKICRKIILKKKYFYLLILYFDSPSHCHLE